MSLSLDFGDGVSDYTDILMDAIVSLRSNPRELLQEQGGDIITAYSSGVITLGPGVFKVSSDTLDFSHDLGLSIKGQGSRRTNNSVRAPTTLLVSGSSSGFGIKTYGAGGRGLTFVDLDICYEEETFTGDLIDSFSSPGLTLTRCFLGTFGISASTRKQSARSVIRATYDEFMSLRDCVIDGTQNGIWFYNGRGAFTFGGSMTQLENCVFYDVTDTSIKVTGPTRPRYGLQLNNVSFNPINMGGIRAVDVSNVNGITINGGIAVGSVGHSPSSEYFRIINSTGYIKGFHFAQGSRAGTISGNLEVSNNVVEGMSGKNGFDVHGGIISSHGNKFSGAGRYGFETPTSPSMPIVLDLGPDQFDGSASASSPAGWACSVNIPVSHANISGRVVRSTMDKSWAGLVNNDPNVSVVNI